MMTSKTTYLGDLRCESEHLQSGTTILTDAPTDNHGKGEKFSPTDLCATSLAECMLTTIAILGKEKHIEIEGATCDVKKVMQAKPRMISELICELKFPKTYSEEDQQFIKQTALNCPVALSLHPDVKKTVSFTFGY